MLALLVPGVGMGGGGAAAPAAATAGGHGFGGHPRIWEPYLTILLGVICGR